MGTRADFYVGKGPSAEWLGSIAWDGYRDGIPGYILKAKREDDYRKAVTAFFAKRDDVTLPKDGWPWPWDDSGTSDCSYWFFDEQTWEELSGQYFPCKLKQPEDDVTGYEKIEYPNMADKKNVTFGKRSGLLIFTAKR